MAKNYYDEKLVDDMILEYQSIVETVEDEKGHKIVINKTPHIEDLETKITIEVMKVVRAIIFLYRYDKWLEYEELESMGIMACFQNYLKFDPKYGSSFNFFSLIVKKCLYGITTRNSKKREKNVYLEDLGDAISAKQEHVLENFVYDLHATLIEIIDSHFLAKKRQKYLLITDVICDYLYKTKSYISKTDMYRFCGCYSLRALDIRQFIHDIKPYYNELSYIIEEEKDQLIDNNQASTSGGSEE